MIKCKKISAVFCTVLVICSMSIPVLAATNVSIYLGANQGWTDRNDTKDSRTGNYSTVTAKCHTVYPDSGFDTFTKIQVRIVDKYAILIGNDAYVTLDEGAPYDTYFSVKEGALAAREVYFQFRGNSSSAANAIVSYSGR